MRGDNTGRQHAIPGRPPWRSVARLALPKPFPIRKLSTTIVAKLLFLLHAKKGNPTNREKNEQEDGEDDPCLNRHFFAFDSLFFASAKGARVWSRLRSARAFCWQNCGYVLRPLIRHSAHVNGKSGFGGWLGDCLNVGDHHFLAASGAGHLQRCLSLRCLENCLASGAGKPQQIAPPLLTGRPAGRSERRVTAGRRTIRGHLREGNRHESLGLSKTRSSQGNGRRQSGVVRRLV